MSSALSVSVPGCWQLKAALILLRSISKSVTIFEKDSTQAGTNMKLSAAFLLASAAFLSTEAAAASQGTLEAVSAAEELTPGVFACVGKQKNDRCIILRGRYAGKQGTCVRAGGKCRKNTPPCLGKKRGDSCTVILGSNAGKTGWCRRDGANGACRI